MSRLTKLLSPAGLAFAVLVTVAVATAPFLPGQDKQAARERLRSFAAGGSPAQIIRDAPKIAPVGAQRIGRALPRSAGIDIANREGPLDLDGLTEEVWIRLDDGRQAKIHMRRADDGQD